MAENTNTSRRIRMNRRCYNCRKNKSKHQISRKKIVCGIDYATRHRDMVCDAHKRTGDADVIKYEKSLMNMYSEEDERA